MIYLLFRKNNKMILSETDIENWDNFLTQMSVKNIIGDTYFCNNTITLVPLDERILMAYKSKNIKLLSEQLAEILYDYHIDPVLVVKIFYIIVLTMMIY